MENQASRMSVDSSVASAKRCKAILNIGSEIMHGKKKETGEHTISGSFILFFSFAMVVCAAVERTLKETVQALDEEK